MRLNCVRKSSSKRLASLLAELDGTLGGNVEKFSPNDAFTLWKKFHQEKVFCEAAADTSIYREGHGHH